MTKSELLSAVLIAAAMLAAPAMARESGVASQRVAAKANTDTTSVASDVDGRACIPAPAVGAFATQPWDNGPPCQPATVN